MKHFFYKGSFNTLKGKEAESTDDQIKIVKKEFAKILESRNLSFLLGSGCSMGIGGIPTMKELATDFYAPSEEVIKNMSVLLSKLILSEESKSTLKDLKIDIFTDPFDKNLETFLGTLYSLKYYFEKIKDEVMLDRLQKVIINTKNFILYKCLNLENHEKDSSIQENYKKFYRKLSLRDSNLPKPNIFTTNYDLYSEKAMDELGITYTNGFSGFIARYFNPSIFNYALAEQMDISSYKWNIIDSFIYLFKIHGSVNWIEVQESNKLFGIKELQDFSYDFLVKQSNVMIYPSPIKQNASLGTPYSDLFREFQTRITQKQSILVTMGYSFCDEHINNLIYQALTIPTFRLVVFCEMGRFNDEKYECSNNIVEQLMLLNDPRIWIIGSNKQFKGSVFEEELTSEKELFHFSIISNDLLPDWSENQIENNNEKIIELMKKSVINESTNIND